MAKNFRFFRKVEERIASYTPPFTSPLFNGLTEFRQPSPIEDMNFVELPCVHSTYPAVHYRNDVYALFHMQDLTRMELSRLSQFLQNAGKSASSLRSVREKMSDAQLRQFIKSRYIQSPSELLRWSAWLDDNYKMEVERINKELAEKEKLNNPDPATSPAPSSSSSSE
jgi:hypothetical protein